jgi:hypothetical protein
MRVRVEVGIRVKYKVKLVVEPGKGETMSS